MRVDEVTPETVRPVRRAWLSPNVRQYSADGVGRRAVAFGGTA